MTRIVIVTLLIFLFGCVFNADYEVIKKENIALKKRISELQTEIKEHETEIIRSNAVPQKEIEQHNCNTDFLIGNWYLVGYLDSIEANKEIYKYSIANNSISASYAQMVLKDVNEPIICNGYYESGELEFIKKEDNHLFFGYDGEPIIGVHIDISKIDTLLNVNFLSNNESYLYKKQNYNFNISHETLKIFLSERLFEGKYSLGGKSIELSKNGRISGLPSFTRFDVIVAPYDEHAGFDQILLWNETSDKKRYGWKFVGKFLVVYDLIKSVDEGSGFFSYTLEKERLKLERL